MEKQHNQGNVNNNQSSDRDLREEIPEEVDDGFKTDISIPGILREMEMNTANKSCPTLFVIT